MARVSGRCTVAAGTGADWLAVGTLPDATAGTREGTTGVTAGVSVVRGTAIGIGGAVLRFYCQCFFGVGYTRLVVVHLQVTEGFGAEGIGIIG